MALEFVEKLCELYRNQRSGVLRLERGPAKKQIVLSFGRIACAESTLPEEHLARVLLRMGTLERSDFAPITSQIKKGKPVDAAILEASKLDRPRLEEGVREQAISILTSLFGWEDAASRFYPGDGLVKRDLDLRLDTPEALVSAARRAAEEQALPPALTDPRRVLCRSSPANVLDWPLDRQEAFAYASTFDPISIGDLIRVIPAGTVKPENLLFRLFLLGIGTRRPTEPVRSL
jgi:hypothetical protein